MNKSTRPGRRRPWLLPVLGGIVFVVLTVFSVVGWRSITVERAEPDQADLRFTAIRNQFSGTEPLLRVEPDGRVVRRRRGAANVNRRTACASLPTDRAFGAW